MNETATTEPVLVGLKDSTVKVWHLILATLTLLGGVVYSVHDASVRIETRFAIIEQTDALTAVRITNIEDKIKGFDRLVERREEQWREVLSSLATQSEKLDSISARLDRQEGKTQ